MVIGACAVLEFALTLAGEVISTLKAAGSCSDELV